MARARWLNLSSVVTIILTLLQTNPVLGDEKYVKNQLHQGETASIEDSKTVSKRIIEHAQDRLWNKGIVPYEFQEEELSEVNKLDIQAVMQTFERFTCIRFIPWVSNTETNDRLGLDRKHVLFINHHDGCYTGGHYAGHPDFFVSCCDQSICVHEMGHALGMYHEEQSPSPERNYLVRYNLDIMDAARRRIMLPYSPEKVFTAGYDLSSFMQLHHNFREAGKGPFYTLLYPEYDVGYSYYYMLSEISYAHKCYDYCRGGPKCENDGYLTVVDGHCACRCVNGLDPATGCANISKSDNFFYTKKQLLLEFPGGDYAMPAPSSGCPDDTFILKSKNIGASQNADMCVSSGSESDTKWPDGSFCLFKKDSADCPEGFIKGRSLLVDYTTEIFYCCKNVRVSDEKMLLPSGTPLTLIKYKTTDCPPVKGMMYTVEAVKMDGVPYKDDYTPIDEDNHLIYCHYTPEMFDYFFSTKKQLEFPGGDYAMPAPSKGCPDDTFIKKSIDIGDSQNVDMCVSSRSESDTKWPGGNFCLFKKHSADCPKGFKEGTTVLTDPAKKTGYCCKRFGFSYEELFLPSREPITLMKYPDAKRDCQAIKGMHYTVETVKVYGITSKEGYTPLDDENYITYCHYTPATIDCGDVYHLSASNPTVTFSSRVESELQCYWLIKAPKGERVVVDFTKHDISCDSSDELEIRYDRVGYPGQKKCGKQLDENYISFNNSFYIRLSTFGDSKSSFTATAKLIQNDELCYNPDDHGQSYVGNVNFTRNFEECMPWSEVTHCPYHAFSEKSATSSNLKENYCRNPDQTTGIMPWCYIKSKYCDRNYCDVCLHRKRVDKRTDCDQLKAEGKCPLERCALTCKDNYPVDPPVKTSSIGCANPDPVVVDGKLVSRPRSVVRRAEVGDENGYKKLYRVGERVTYGCKYDSSTVDSVCLTSGKWSYIGTACPNHESRSCVDVSNECRRLFRINPAMCSLYPDFANTHCSFTCGICDFNERTTCSVRGTNGSDYTPSDSRREIYKGESIKYTCKDGLVPLTEKSTRGCQTTGKMTKFDLTCVKDCPEGWTYNVETRSCYKRFLNKVWYKTALTACSRLGGWVAMPKTKTQTDFLIANIYPDVDWEVSYWIGATDEEEEGVFRWADGEEVGHCSDWYYRQPDNYWESENCVIIFKYGLWNDVYCTSLRNYACQVPINVCEEGWLYNGETRSCYKLFDKPVQYEAAKSSCNQLGGFVAMPKTNAQTAFLTANMYSALGTSFWIGVTLDRKDNKHRWADGGEVGTSSNWDDWQPDDWMGRESCAQVTNRGRWNDISCYSVATYACQVPFNGPSKKP